MLTNNLRLCYNQRKVVGDGGERLGEVIYRLRINRKLTQKELAEKCGVTQQFIQRIEKGKVNPSITTVIKLAAALGTSTDTILGRKAG